MKNYEYPTVVDDLYMNQFRIDIKICLGFIGWSYEELSDQLDITRATTLRIINRPGYMSKMHYLAITRLIEKEAKTNLYLQEAINIMNGYPSQYSISNTELIDAYNSIIMSTSRKLGKKEVKKRLEELLKERSKF